VKNGGEVYVHYILDTQKMSVKTEIRYLLVEKCKQISHNSKYALWQCQQQRSDLRNASYHIVWICNDHKPICCDTDNSARKSGMDRI